MNSKKLFIYLLIITSLYACKDYHFEIPDLPTMGIISFNNNLTLSEVGYDEKNDLTQLSNGTYVATGTSPEGILLVDFYTEEGVLDSMRFNTEQTGVGHRIIPLNNQKDDCLIIGTDGNSSFLTKLNADTVYFHTDYFNQLNQLFGILDSLVLYDGLLDKRDSSIYLAGYSRQTVGERRMLILQVDLDGRLIKPITFEDNTYCTAIQAVDNNYFAISGFKDGKAFVQLINKLGAQIWIKENLPVQRFYTSLAIIGSNTYMLGTSNRGVSKMYVIGISIDGDIIINDHYGDDNGIGVAICADRNGNLILSGSKNRESQNAKQQLISINGQTGDVNWRELNLQSFPGILTSRVFQTQDFGFVTLGIHGNSNNGYFFQLIKTDEEGVYR